MAYDRYDTRDERSRWQRDRSSSNESSDWNRDRDQRGGNERGFFERAGDEIASWFGDDDAERRRRQDQSQEGRSSYDRGENRDRYSSSNYGHWSGSDRDQDHRGRHDRDSSSDRWQSRDRNDESRGWPTRQSSENRYWSGNERSNEGNYRPMTGDYGRSERYSGSFGPTQRWDRGQEDRSSGGGYNRSEEPWGRDEYRSSSRAGTSDWSDRSRHEDPHYQSWRKQQVESLDRDYDDYRREHQQKFESDFGNWRQQRQHKRGLLGQIREHMEVVGNDDQHIGKVDRTAGDRIILAKSDPESGGAHHSLSCSEIDRVEDNKVILGCSAEQAKQHWRDESRSRALFEREDQGEMGPRTLNRSFEGTYR